MILRVEVTQANIDSGVCASCNRCPVALAVKQALPHDIRLGRVSTGAVLISYIGLRASERLIPLPIEARRFIVDFDAGASVEPFAFTLDLSLARGVSS